MPWDKKPAVMGQLDRRLAGADARGPGPRGGHGGDRPRGLPRRSCLCRRPCSGWWARCCSNPLTRRARRDHALVRPVQVRLDETPSMSRRRTAFTTPTTWPGPGSPWPRWPTPISTRGPSRRSTRRTPIGARCSSSTGRRTTTVPWAIANAAYKRQKRNSSVTEIKKDAQPAATSLTIDHGLARGRADRA